MADNKKIAEQVLAAVGGAANLKDATHCMTRLRLYLKDDSLPKDDEVKKISSERITEPISWVLSSRPTYHFTDQPPHTVTSLEALNE